MKYIGESTLWYKPLTGDDIETEYKIIVVWVNKIYFSGNFYAKINNEDEWIRVEENDTDDYKYKFRYTLHQSVKDKLEMEYNFVLRENKLKRILS